MQATRDDPALSPWAASPRASIALLRASRALAASDGRTHVYPDDVRTVLRAVMAHRIVLNPDAILRGDTVDAVLERIVRRGEAAAVGASGASSTTSRRVAQEGRQGGELGPELRCAIPRIVRRRSASSRGTGAAVQTRLDRVARRALGRIHPRRIEAAQRKIGITRSGQIALVGASCTVGHRPGSSAGTAMYLFAYGLVLLLVVGLSC